MNTTALITHWTMDGARGDLDRRFSPPVDILAAVSELTPEPVEVKVEPPLVDIFIVTPPTITLFGSVGDTQMALL